MMFFSFECIFSSWTVEKGTARDFLLALDHPEMAFWIGQSRATDRYWLCTYYEPGSMYTDTNVGRTDSVPALWGSPQSILSWSLF